MCLTFFQTTVSVYDWFNMESIEYPAKQRSHIISSDVIVFFIGGRFRTFKPGTPLQVYVSGRLFFYMYMYMCEFGKSCTRTDRSPKRRRNAIQTQQSNVSFSGRCDVISVDDAFEQNRTNRAR